MSFPVDVVVMAAGKGTRMKSGKPKVLHRLGGRALAQHVIDTAAGVSARSVVVITGHGAEAVEAGLAAHAGTELKYVRQEPQLGTGHAVQQALPALADDGVVLVLNGDVPLIEASTLQSLIEASGGQHLVLLTVEAGDATGYGRVIRAPGRLESVLAIVEEKDATVEQRAVTEWYSGVLAAPAALLRQLLGMLKNDNSQQEFYLTDIVKHAVSLGKSVYGLTTHDGVQVAGVNSPVQLAELERAYQLRGARALMEKGVRLADPARLDVRGALMCGADVEIDVNVVFEGRVSLGDGVRVGANCVISNAAIGAGAVIHPFTHIDGEKLGVGVGPGALIGPFARLRPGAQLGAQVHIGNFVEVKNSTLADGAKANHLTYIGDATVGERVNVGAGTITANYDGANKHRTVIEADAHIGSNSVLVAPVTIGAGGTVGAGSVISKDTPPGSLAVARGKALVVPNWSRPAKMKP
ncbi:bifunctional N-acetylglucosamine-1-phosphate uridyltransferase/glucosamine-1-phosphate acetyltransferase [Hydrogenophaga crassostreae]|uniref:Bifunctional protein GlmU n=1 Tax=Hydrogenophaga crassostreae TaxID=1763535 RepID=A0A167IMF7_9BURK|nr:bifunctional UDP-N-acetylglucosamine diphosphorylase/glucosamine-1-phosphate N-acetyltransferase GlmU [Hydrogenophaga crassostreae]AOW14716.1 UDP-N-acetylglucosamine diphosphorylase/glucosamine-1-phosphate N-acetyltransferase [Hydrogenophaga crassostreae]OAD43188.1 bifunctional N-acetylglucosamine-1-phosphate uridyltransferase/glucosamine-1-phosphate acetyltransferase [Hydrogenophaga crassostreae]